MRAFYQKLNRSLGAALLLLFWAGSVFPLSCQFFVEWVRLQSLPGAVWYFAGHLPAALLGTAFLAGVGLACALATRRLWPGVLAVGGSLFVGAYVNFYKLTYRGDPVLPKDLVIAGDAAKVATELSIPPTFQMGAFMLFLTLVMLAVAPVRLQLYKAAGLKNWRRWACAAAAAAACGGWLCGVLWDERLQQRIGVDTLAFAPAKSYEQATFLTGFLLYMGSVSPRPPAGYGPQAVAEAARLLPAEGVVGSRRPDVVVVMLESYYRLDNLPGAVFSENLTENYDRWAAQGISGFYYSDKYSGGTEEMEFGALTGFSTSLLPTGSIPYVEYVRGRFPSYVRFLKEQGYTTLALHPYDPTIYSRDKAYPAMGFDRFYSLEDLEDLQQHGAYVDDLATAQKLIELYEEATAEGGSVFLHAVTMQNHIPNEPGEYPQDYRVRARLEGVEDYYLDCLESVATGLRDADRAIGLLCDYFSHCKRDVVVLFFGDHQTAIGDHKGRELLDELPGFAALGEEERLEATHRVPYLIWSNFESRPGQTAGAMPPYQLLATALQEYDLLRPAWFEFLAQGKQLMAGVNLGQVIGPDGQLQGPLEQASAAQQQLWQAQRMLQYDAIFGERYAFARMYGFSP